MALAFGHLPGLRATWRNFIGETYVRLAMLWPDRFNTRAWRDRFTVTGLDDLLACHAEGHPIVLAVIHAHHLNLLRLFLRANGLPVASLNYRPGVTPIRVLINAAVDKHSQLTGTPHKFPLTQLRSAYAFLRSGGCLLVACDKPSDDYVELPTGLGPIRIHLGPLRLAAMTNARVVPAVSWQEGPWQFHFTFREPCIPPAHSADAPAFNRLAEQCLDTWQPLLRKHPAQHNAIPGAWNVPPRPGAEAARS